MPNEKSLYEAIYSRYSVRKYENREVEKEKLDEILNTEKNSLAGVDVKFISMDCEKARQHMIKFPGMGNLFNAPVYLIIAAKQAPHFMIETGYQGERVILTATSLGLGTCWIGALFSEEGLRDELGVDKSFRVIAISPIGYSSTGMMDTMVEGFIRRSAGSVHRKPIREIVFAEKYGSPMDSFSGGYSRWENIFKAVRVAPSWCNLQPWRFIVRGDSVYATLVPPAEKKGIKSAHIKSGMDYSFLDLGIAMSHFDLACGAEGIIGSWKLFEDDKSEMRSQLQIPPDHRLIGVWKQDIKQ